MRRSLHPERVRPSLPRNAKTVVAMPLAAPAPPLVPDLSMPIVGWRLWAACRQRQGWTLRSPFHHTAWRAHEPLEAGCGARRRPWRRRPPHHAPQLACDCGIYGLTWPSFVRYAGFGMLHDKQLPVLGEVALWGEVVEAERGWRAEFAYPTRLFVPLVSNATDHVPELIVDLGRYDVDVATVSGSSAAEILVRLERRWLVTP
jgi:hypothetical protein